jgi:hypothetical protein
MPVSSAQESVGPGTARRLGRGRACDSAWTETKGDG